MEQRVDSLIGLLAANGQPAGGNNALAASAPATSDTSPEETLAPNETRHAPMHYITPVDSPDHPAPGNLAVTRKYYDPIEVGIIDHASAILLLDEFRAHCVLSFPFVVIPQAAGVDTLRQRLPFLFLAIMAVMTYRQPTIQRKLGDEFKNQVAVRVIGQSHRSLEILEAILVYSAWYQSFYRPQSQLLATMLQLCVAMVRDLGLAKNPRDSAHKRPFFEEDCGLLFKVEPSTAERRALLGTYYLNMALVPTYVPFMAKLTISNRYSQTWRHNSAFPFTKYMNQCCKFLAEQKEEPTDELIDPLVQVCVLLDRAGEHFSYHDIDNGEIKGDLMLEMSTSSFRSELNQMKSTVPPTFTDNSVSALPSSFNHIVLTSE